MAKGACEITGFSNTLITTCHHAWGFNFQAYTVVCSSPTPRLSFIYVDAITRLCGTALMLSLL